MAENQPVNPLSAEQFAETITFRRQAALLLFAGALAEENKRRGHTFKNFTLLEGQAATAASNLVARKGVEELMNLTSAQIGALVPRIRIIKSVYKGLREGEPFDMNNFEDVEFVFKDHLNPEPSPDFDPTWGNIAGYTGNVGLKSFNYIFDGGDPATAYFAQCKMVLSFRNFQDMLAFHYDDSGNQLRFLDLLLTQEMYDTNGHGFNPDYYVIKAVVGWAVPKGDIIPRNLRNVLNSYSLVLILTLVNHDIDVNEDGSVELTINYRGRIDSAFLSAQSDILADNEVVKAKSDLFSVRAEQQEQAQNAEVARSEILGTGFNLDEAINWDMYQAAIASGLPAPSFGFDTFGPPNVTNEEFLFEILSPYVEEGRGGTDPIGLLESENPEFAEYLQEQLGEGNYQKFSDSFATYFSAKNVNTVDRNTTTLETHEQNLAGALTGRYTKLLFEIMKGDRIFYADVRRDFLVAFDQYSHAIDLALGNNVGELTNYDEIVRKRNEALEQIESYAIYPRSLGEYYPNFYNDFEQDITNVIETEAIAGKEISTLGSLEGLAEGSDFASRQGGVSIGGLSSLLESQDPQLGDTGITVSEYNTYHNNLQDIDGQIYDGGTSGTPGLAINSERLEWIFFGDIVDAALTALKNNNSPMYKNVKILLGSVQLFSGEKTIEINLADLPISTELFTNWFLEHITRPQLTTYLFRDFLRDVIKTLIPAATKGLLVPTDVQGLGELDAIAFSLASKDRGEDIFQKLSTNSRIDTASDSFVDNLKDAQLLGYQKNQVYLDYILINASRLTSLNMEGDAEDDFRQGVYHFFVGNEKGLLRRIKWKKEDNADLQSSNLLNSKGNHGIEVLRDYYNAEMHMVGNPLFYPGQMLYIDPTLQGVGSTKQVSALARKLGMGGYYNIIRVEGSLGGEKNYKLIVDTIWSGFPGELLDGSRKVSGAAINEEDDPETQAAAILEEQDAEIDFDPEAGLDEDQFIELATESLTPDF